MRENKVRILWGIILLGLGLRLINLFSPLLDLYPIRQEYCAMVARNFLRQGLNIFNPHADWVGNLNSYWSIELPLISFITALLYKIFGLHEYLGRLVAILFSLGSIYFFYKLVRLYFDEMTSLFSAFCFTVLPLNLYLSRTFMPESPLIFFSVLSLYILSLWVRTDRDIFFILAMLSAAMTFLAKVSSLYLCLPFLFLFYLKYGRRFVLSWRVWVFAILVAVPVIFWYSRSHLKMSFYTQDPENFQYLFYPDFYRRIFESMGIFVLSPPGLILCFWGLFLKTENRQQYLFHLWFMGVFIFVLLFPKINYVQYHYQLPFSAPCALFMGRAITLIYNKELVKQSIFSRFLNSKEFVAVLMIILLVCSLLILRPCYKWNRFTYEAAGLINKFTEKDSIIIAGRCTQEAPLYYCDRKGWVINEYGQLSYVYGWAHKDLRLRDFPKLEEIELVRYLIKEGGADYYLAANLDAFNANPRLVKFLKDNFEIWHQTDKYIIFKLR